MTNTQILEKAVKEAGLGDNVIFNTYQGWKALGYQVKKGEKASFQAEIWHPKKSKMTIKEMTGQESEAEILEHFWRKKASYFLLEQVEKIEN